MPYLTYSEYVSFLFTEVDESEFDRLLNRASDVLNSVTGDFYQLNILETDFPYRRDKFKKAVACQIEYFKVLGATTFEEINSSPQSFSAGRTSVSNSSRYNPGGANESKSLVAEEVLIHLGRTGLLYRGVSVR
ncbi:hypothetical protein [Sporosarcina sp. FA9]|uniref:hypothetical protein n=1 Tax=Sporosarcina sp. FA9 TaxID=3413030 RepID=UPI003F65E658